jgi:hypothetical protein
MRAIAYSGLTCGSYRGHTPLHVSRCPAGLTGLLNNQHTFYGGFTGPCTLPEVCRGTWGGAVLLQRYQQPCMAARAVAGHIAGSEAHSRRSRLHCSICFELPCSTPSCSACRTPERGPRAPIPNAELVSDQQAVPLALQPRSSQLRMG